MRLIDAMGLKQSIALSTILNDGKTLEQIIDEQPTIEPERKTGKWIRDNKYPEDSGFVNPVICSLCREQAITDCSVEGYVFSKFCPNCGAKMEVKHE